MNILTNNNSSNFYRMGNIPIEQICEFDDLELQPLVPFLYKNKMYKDLTNRNSVINENTFDGLELSIYKLNSEYWDDSLIKNDFNNEYGDEIERIKELVLSKEECPYNYLWQKDSYQFSTYSYLEDIDEFYDIYRLLDEHGEEIWAFGVKRGTCKENHRGMYRRKEDFDFTQDIELEVYNGKSISEYLEIPRYNPRQRSFKMKTLKR